MLVLADLPEDVLLLIIYLLSPLDIIRLRQVSKTLYSVTSQPYVWIRAYKSAALPLPPGPYVHTDDKAALKFLECRLVRSANLEPWSAHSFGITPRHTFPGFGHLHRFHNFHFPSWGSWLITTIGLSIVYRKLESGYPETHVLYRLNAPDELEPNGVHGVSIQCADTVSLLGHPVTYALFGGYANGRSRIVILLKIVGHLGHSLSVESTIPLSFGGDRFQDIIANPRYVCVSRDGVSKDGKFRLALLDVTTKKMYQLPPFRSTVAPETLEALVAGRSVITHCADFHLTDTHIVASLITVVPGDYHIQAFLLPSEADSGAEDDGMLRMTHEGICKIIRSPKWVLRGNIVTNTGGVKTTVIRLMNYHLKMCQPYSWEVDFNIIDLKLSPSPGVGPGTITLSQYAPFLSFKDAWFMNFSVACSQDGFGRGVCQFTSLAFDKEYTQTFSVDASGEICRADLGPRKNTEALVKGWPAQFDLWNGRGCYVSQDSVNIHDFAPISPVVASPSRT